MVLLKEKPKADSMTVEGLKWHKSIHNSEHISTQTITKSKSIDNYEKFKNR